MACTLTSWAFTRWRATAVVFDDSLISFRYARNWVDGHGLVYNVGERVEGYTNFLWTAVAAAAIRGGLDPLTATRGLGVAAYLATVATVTLVACRPGASFRRCRPVCVALAMLLIVPSGFPAFAGTGLETSFVGLLVLGIGLSHHLSARGGLAARLVAATLPLVAVLTRMDLAAAVIASAFALVIRNLRSRLGWRALVRTLLWSHGPTVVGLAIYLLWKKSYYGDFLPNTFYAKAADHVHAEPGLAYVRTFVQSDPCALPLVLLAVAGIVFERRDRHRASFFVYAAMAIVFHVVYVIRVGGDFMEYRFMWEYWPLLVCASVMGAETLSRFGVLLPAAGAALALAVAGTSTVLEKKWGMQSRDEMSRYERMSEEVGGALERALPPGTSVATTLAGMGYFMPDVITIDQWGLNDRAVARTVLPRVDGADAFNARGHLKRASLQYLRERSVNLLVDHPAICDCDQPCIEDKPDVFVRLSDRQRCVRGWYLTQTPELTRWFCRHPDTFVLAGVPCAVPSAVSSRRD